MIRMIAYACASLGRDCLVSRLSGREDIGVLAAGDALDELVSATQGREVDVVLVLPATGGPPPLARIRSYWPTARVVLGRFDGSDAPDAAVVGAGALWSVSLTGSVDALVRQLACPGEVSRRGAGVGAGARSAEAKGGLSLREVDVLKHLALGHSSRESAGLLGLSPRTVDGHRRRVSDKLERTSVAQLTRYAIAKGLIRAASGLSLARSPLPAA